MDKKIISEQEAVALLRYGRVYMADGSFQYALGPYPVAGTDLWVVGGHEQRRTTHMGNTLVQQHRLHFCE